MTEKNNENYPYSFPSEKDPLLHIYGPYDSHGDTWIFGNTIALKKLHAALGDLLEGRCTKNDNGVTTRGVGAWVTDGEGFTLFVVLDDDKHRWDKVALPYTAEYFNKEGLPFLDIIGKETYKKEHERGCKDLEEIVQDATQMKPGGPANP